ncbi:class I SAM-dependent methyltransferase [Candidatus Kaiserbacteria bacterium]|nr:class I SAM-dependent methyltransferase [Candidatus Kaiserbacteria bacterium]
MSIIYRSIYLYRAVMWLLYLGKYRKRFTRITDLLRESDKTVLELCFGDIYIAEYCKAHSKKWIGYDISEHFVTYARRIGFDARREDISLLAKFPENDVCVMIGSLYHFHKELRELFGKILHAAPRFILSEPVINWTNKGGFLSSLARLFTGAGKGHESFRFDEASLIETLEALKRELRFDYKVVHKDRDMVVEIRRAI